MSSQGKRSQLISWGKLLLLTKLEEHNTLIVGRGGGQMAQEALKLYGVDVPIIEDDAFGARAFIWHRWQDLASVGEAMEAEKVEKAAEEAANDGD